jgi:hypothetical protein
MRHPRVAIFVAFFALYLLGESREALWADSKAAYIVAEHLVDGLGYDIGYPWPAGAPRGKDGKFYSVYPLLPSLVQVPAAWAQTQVMERWPGAAGFTSPLFSHAACAFFAALACALFYGLQRKLGVGPLAASLVTVALGVGSLLFPYAHDPFSESLQTACFTGFFAELIDTSERRSRGLALGAWAGLLINTKLIFVLVLPGAAIYLLARLWGDWRRLAATALIAALGLAPFIWMSLDYSYARWGTYAEPTIATNQSLFRENAFLGLWGFVASLGRSVFRYSPPLVVSLVALPVFWRAHRRVALAALLTVTPIVYLYCKYALWPGDHAWGPRYLLFLHPVALAPAAVLLDGLIARGLRLWEKTVLALILAIGIFVQILGVALWRGHFIRLSHDAAQAWLGMPRKTLEGGIEDFYMRVWLPPFDPIAGHAWLLRHVLAGDSAEVAGADAPWRRYTAAPLPLGPVYGSVRIDWWPLRFNIKDPRHRLLGLTILGAESFFLAAGVAWWVFSLRGRRRQGTSEGPIPHS